MNLFLLQSDLSYLAPRSNLSVSGNAQFVAIGIGILIIILLIANQARKKQGGKTGGGSVSSGGPKFFSSFTLHRITGDMGLNREQVNMLDYVMKSGSINDPERFLNSPELIDRHFKRTYRLIERTSGRNEEELNKRLSVLFSTRNIIEANSKIAVTTSTRQIPEKAPAVLTIDKMNYPVKIISTRGDTLTVEKPHRSAGGVIHPSKGSKVTLAFFTKSATGFSVETRVIGTTESAGSPALQLAHSGQIKRLSSRRFRRRDISIDTEFYMIFQDGHTKKLIVDKRRNTGKILDISIGGCSIKTSAPANMGQRIKVEFFQGDDFKVTALGEVLRVSRSGISTIIHVKFLKVPLKSLNVINAIVYEYVAH
jgi:hypothetical protein